jgi:transposase
MNIKRLAVDLAKDIFQLYGVDEEGKQVLEKRIKSRAKFAEFVIKLGPCELVMEACGGANYWARKFIELGYKVMLISPQYVKPYVQRNKNDFRYVRGIMEASYWSGISFVTPKTIEQQDIQSLLRIRNNYLEMRTATSNQIRGLMNEYGVTVKKGYESLRHELPSLFERYNENGLSIMIKELIEGQYNMLLVIEEQIDTLDIQIDQLSSANETCNRLQKIEGIGPISALAIIALVGNGSGFKNGRHFAAYMGLTPKQHSSGNRECLLGISKRGDRYLRTLLIHGGRAVVRTAEKKNDYRSNWINRIKDKGGFNKAAVAVANKNARIVMAMILSGEAYKKAI